MAILAESLDQSSGPSLEPITVADAKRYAQVTGDEDDKWFSELITWARETYERDTQRALITQTWVLRLNCFPSADWIDLRKYPVSSITSIQYVDTAGNTQTFGSSNYSLLSQRRPGAVALTYGNDWPLTRDQWDAVTITYVCGFGATRASVPEHDKQALLVAAREGYVNKECNRAGLHANMAYMSHVNRWAVPHYP